MIKIVYIVDGHEVDTIHAIASDQPRIKIQLDEASIREACASIVCQEHGEKAYATIILGANSSHQIWKHQIIDCCCDNFAQKIKDANSPLLLG